jgi:hypothetical protein
MENLAVSHFLQFLDNRCAVYHSVSFFRILRDIISATCVSQSVLIKSWAFSEPFYAEIAPKSYTARAAAHCVGNSLIITPIQRKLPELCFRKLIWLSNTSILIVPVSIGPALDTVSNFDTFHSDWFCNCQTHRISASGMDWWGTVSCKLYVCLVD